MRYESRIGKGFHRWSEGIYPHGQIAAMNDFESSFVLMSGSYRSGKTEGLARILIRHACFFPDAKVGIFRAHLASLRRSTLLTVLELLHPSWIKEWSNTHLEAKLLNDSVISFIGADYSDRLGSIELTIAGIDEATEVSSESLGMIQGRLSGALRLPDNFDELPENIQVYLEQTIDLRQTFLACNPKSNGHYIYEQFIGSPKPGHVHYASNSISNPNLPEIYLINNLSAYVRPGISIEWVKEQVRKVREGEANPDGLHLAPHLTPFGQRNLLGLWVALEGAIYDLDQDLHYLEKPPENWLSQGVYYVGVDYGFHNPRICVLEKFKVDRGTAYMVVDGWHKNGATGEDLVNACIKFDERYNVANFYFPHDQPGIFKMAKRSISSSRVKRAKTAVFPGITLVMRFFNKVRLTVSKKFSDSELVWTELTGYQWQQDRDGNFTDEPVKKDDHYPDSIRYALFTLHYGEDVTNQQDTLPQISLDMFE
ncbi:MAG: phage terminase large subunit [Cyanobacteria bacterium J06638_38]